MKTDRIEYIKTDKIEYIIESDQGGYLDLWEIWRYRELLYFFTWRDLKVKYKHTVLGVVWVLIQPLFLIMILTFFFSKALSFTELTVPYPIYAFSGLICWNFFSSGITNAGNSMLANSEVIKKVYFPRLLIPLSAILSSSIDFLLSSVVFILILLFFGVKFSLLQFLIATPITLITLWIGTIGLGCWLSALTVKFRDFRYVIPFLLQILFFLTPIIYPISIIENVAGKMLFYLNPMYSAMVLIRWPIMGESLEILPIFISLFSSLIFWTAGLFYFRRTEKYFADLA